MATELARGLAAGEHHSTAERQSAERGDHVHLQRSVGARFDRRLVGQYTTGRGATLANGNVSFIQGTACATLIAGCTFYAQPTGFGNLHRNALTGPGFADTDVSLEKTTKITETTALVAAYRCLRLAEPR